MNIKATVSALALTGALLLTSCAAPTSAPTAPSMATSAPSVARESSPQPFKPLEATACEEDMPCWDCKTMGNLICGPQSPALTAPAVGPKN